MLPALQSPVNPTPPLQGGRCGWWDVVISASDEGVSPAQRFLWPQVAAGSQQQWCPEQDPEADARSQGTR